MTAIATLRRPVWRGPHSPRHGVTTILRGASWKAGWVIVAHALAGTGDRLMPYPTSGFNSAVTAANGGPLQVPGGDVNGTLRVIAKIPNARFYMPTTGAGSAAAVQVTHGSVTTVIVTIGSATTALTVWQAVRAHAEANEVVDIGLAGTGASLAVAISTTDAPYVRIYGVARADVDNSADLTTDATLTLGTPEEACGDAGQYGLEMSDSGSAPGPAYLVDNQTVTFLKAPLLLPTPCRSIENGLAFCDLAVGYR